MSSRHSSFRKYRSPPSGLPFSIQGISPSSTHQFHRQSYTAAVESLEPRALLAATVLADYVVTQNWGSGFQGQVKLTNQQTTAVANWTLEFDFGANITSIWDGKIVSHSGSHYTIANAGWNSTLAAGGQVSFGFVAAPVGTPAAPANYVLNGKPLSGGTTPPVLPSLSIADVSLAEGNSGTKSASFTVTLSAPATSNVTVNFASRDGSAPGTSATAGSDYTAASGKLTFSPGQTSKTINVPVIGDTVFESDESFYLDLSAAVGATLARSTATGTITNDDAAPPPPSNPSSGVPAAITFINTNDWANGFNGDVAIRNTGTGTIHGWKLQFTFNGTISSIWNATIASHTGNIYVIQAASWNSDIAAGASVDFGFTASPGGAAAVLSNYVLTGTVDSGTTNGGGSNGGGSSGGSGNNGGSTGTSNQPIASSAVAWPTHYYAPYVDSTLWPLYDFVSTAKTSGLKFFTLAFITADPANKPAWGGFAAYDVGTTDFDVQMKTNITALRAIGGDVMVSFGGAANQELALVITNVSDLTAAYQSVVTNYGLTHIDFDIEGAAVADRASIDRRSQAIAALQQAATAAGHKLDVWFTLPVLPTGLTADGLYVIQSALKYGVNIAGINIMTMDYGDGPAPNPAGHMGDYAIQAATSLFGQLKTAYAGTQTDAQLWAKVGLTPMIGMNDLTDEVFTQADAQKMLAFAQQHGIDRISIWSLNRDYQNSAGTLNHVDNFSSSLLQSPLEFSLMLNQLTR
ncbi:MAG TPA: cellulose binding domain-containing protein [Pirellulales bacterium]